MVIGILLLLSAGLMLIDKSLSEACQSLADRQRNFSNLTHEERIKLVELCGAAGYKQLK